MSSGYGIRGGIGRCYPFFAGYKECLKTETTSTGLDCKDFREDYFECLHHRKEYERLDIIKEQAKLNEIKAAGGGVGGGDEH